MKVLVWSRVQGPPHGSREIRGPAVCSSQGLTELATPLTASPSTTHPQNPRQPQPRLCRSTEDSAEGTNTGRLTKTWPLWGMNLPLVSTLQRWPPRPDPLKPGCCAAPTAPTRRGKGVRVLWTRGSRV